MRILPAVVLLVAVAVAGCGANGDEAASPSATATLESGSGPDISGAGLDGEALNVAEFRGKPVFVNVWSSW